MDDNWRIGVRQSLAGCVLIAQIAVFLQSLVDDPLQIERHVGGSVVREAAEPDSGWTRKSLLCFRHGTATSRLPSRTAPPRRRTGRCVRPTPWHGLALATYRQSFPMHFPDWSDANNSSRGEPPLSMPRCLVIRDIPDTEKWVPATAIENGAEPRVPRFRPLFAAR
jgi:hypothetical protein